MNKSCITNICNLSLLLMIEYKGNEKKIINATFIRNEWRLKETWYPPVMKVMANCYMIRIVKMRDCKIKGVQ